MVQDFCVIVVYVILNYVIHIYTVYIYITTVGQLRVKEVATSGTRILNHHHYL
jgi:hypothetical protein